MCKELAILCITVSIEITSSSEIWVDFIAQREQVLASYLIKEMSETCITSDETLRMKHSTQPLIRLGFRA